MRIKRFNENIDRKLIDPYNGENNRASNIIPKLWIQIKLTGRGAFQTASCSKIDFTT